jgi:putative transposase
MTGHQISERRACRIVNLSRSLRQYQPCSRHDEEVIQALKHLADHYPRWGFHKMFAWLRHQGHEWNHKRVYRVYCVMKLNLRISKRKRLPKRFPEPLVEPDAMNSCWSMDFMSDALLTGRRIRTLNIMDDFNREVLAIEIDTSLPAKRVIRVLDQLIDGRGSPQRIRVDNGPEFISSALALWAEDHQITLDFIRPGRPDQNAYIERFNPTYREDVLDTYLFRNLEEVRAITQQWISSYNQDRPHDALGGLSPIAYRDAQTL